MSKLDELLAGGLKVINLGVESFAESLRRQGAAVQQVDWRPPAGGDPEVIRLLARLNRPEVRAVIDAANRKAAERIISAQPVLEDVRPAGEVIPGMSRNLLLHAGPPVSWQAMCGPVRGAVMGALLYEGLAADLAEAEKLAASGKILFEPCHHHQAVGPMAGVVSASMYVYVVRNRTHGNTAFCTLNEGLGRVLRFGAYGPEVIDRLKRMERVLAPALQKGVRQSGGIDLKGLIARALTMGDECHNRNVAATSLFLRAITPHLLSCGLEPRTVREVIEFLSGNDHSFLNLSMAASKASTDPVVGLEHSSIVSAMARNGTELGIRVAGLGERWFTAEAGRPKGLYFPGFGEKDANLDLGDSTVTEIGGLGAAAMAAAPAIVKFVGGSAADAIRATREMYEIAVAEHSTYLIPALDFRGTPVGLDIRRINRLDLLPFINTGIAHREPGIGQIGAGILRAPKACFVEALKAFGRLF